ncbi:hypothetical protein BH11PSE8_BH11PSE8_17710 [soil metagenome]
MTSAILIPLYQPRNRHLLLLKSVISNCSELAGAEIYVMADGPKSDVTWPPGAIEELLGAADLYSLNLRIFSASSNSGYPGCYHAMLAMLVTDPRLTVFHFVDQDDYCLPSRFLHRSSKLTQAGSVLVSDSRYLPMARHRFDTMELSAVLETPSLGMTFSVPRAQVLEYLALWDQQPFVRKIAHDFVISQIALARDSLAAVSGNSMIYIQHEENTIGYGRGAGRIFRWLRNYRSVLSKLKAHSNLLDILYGSSTWRGSKRLHRSPVRSGLYRALLATLSQ